MKIESLSRQVLIHGLLLILFGLVFGLVVPHAPYPRLALGAHIQFITNGMLVLVAGGLLLALPHRVGSRAVAVMVLAAWLVWAMALSEVGNAWWGTAETLPLAAKQAGAVGGVAWQEAVVKVTHIVAGLALIVAWALLTIGFVKAPRSST
jgi:hydroxylaminobenzene mutase